MNAHSAITVASALLCAVVQSRAGEKVTLVAHNAADNFGYSDTITLEKGDSASLTYSGGVTWSRIIVIASGKTFELLPSGKPDIAGPAVMKLRSGLGQAGGSPMMDLATFNIERAGTASNPTPIPQEAGTTWQVILEASADLVNWTAVTPGDYPSSTPQRYFRTRLVKRL